MSATVAAPAVDRRQAIAIAEADAVPLFGNELNVLTLEAALHDDGWHVEYHMRRRGWAGGGPHYVIDADTGVIKSKKYYQ